MKQLILIAIATLALGCNDLVEVRVVAEVPRQEKGWDTIYEHIVVEDTKTHERFVIVGTARGKTGDVFCTRRYLNR